MVFFDFAIPAKPELLLWFRFGLFIKNFWVTKAQIYEYFHF